MVTLFCWIFWWIVYFWTTTFICLCTFFFEKYNLLVAKKDVLGILVLYLESLPLRGLVKIQKVNSLKIG